MLRALVGAVVVLSAVITGVVSAEAGALERVRFVVDGRDREFLLYLPDQSSLPAGRSPLVLVLHGGGGTDRDMMRLTRARWNELADREGFFVVYPNAVDRMWDFGEGDVSEGLDVRVDDLAYFRAVINRAVGVLPVDPDRIFATGISRGAQASWFLACKLPGRMRAIAPVTMPLPEFLADDCRNGPPVGVLVMNGTADPLVPYDGGQIRVFRKDRGQVLSTDQTMAFWRRRNGCADAPTSVEEIDRPGDRTSVVRTDWKDCTGAPVTLYRVDGGGHTWPSGRQYLGSWLIGDVSGDIDGAEEIWRFFKRF